MKLTQKKINKNRFFMIIAIVLGFFLLAVYMLLSDINHTNKSVKRFDHFVRNEMRDIVRNEVLNRIDEIEYDLSMLHKEQNKIIKGKIEMIAHMLLSSDTAKINNMEERKIEFLKEFERIAKADKEYLYFALSTEGILLRSSTDDRREGKNIIDSKDQEGSYYIREMLKVINKQEGIYVTYYSPKEKDGEPLRKTSYCLYIPEFDIIIGTGSYDVDIEKVLKEATFSRIQSYYQDSEDYIFIVGYDGIAHVFGDNRLIGKSTKKIYDTNGKSIHKLFMEAIENDSEGYVNYDYYKRNSKEKSEKISFVKRLDMWEAYIAMGFHVDDLNQELNIHINDFKSEYYKELIFTLILMFFIGLVILYFVRKSLILQSQYIHQEEIVFEKLFQLSSEGILIVSNQGNVIFQNPIINKIIGENLSDYIDKEGQVYFNEISEDVYSIKNDNGRTYYIEWNKKSIIYHGIDSYIYFISDITSKFLKSNELEHMALYDELTKLPNRRKLIDDFKYIIENNTAKDSTVIAMIDLDYFKKVNDEYGHAIGDEVLKLVGECFTNKLRKRDQIYRLGGEEFIVLLRDITIEDAQSVLTNICNEFYDMSKERFGFPITFSGGATEVELNLYGEVCLGDVLNKADILLYKAKNKGRARIEI
ncbi:cache domain-containing protein [Tepidibacter hydrothermalis]|uniref:Cache domain-containing protein n=1 Tax=Tepidibacter hydrothermalis TaxID=3036126 RepID=A0ABY8EBD2_9FIRM|nr:cache domain-containing protein [Tepidibacter hydrothermalis]WFD10226.1 cache domain-containing protein [Tepidibacter hydrothermalis]